MRVAARGWEQPPQRWYALLNELPGLLLVAIGVLRRQALSLQILPRSSGLNVQPVAACTFERRVHASCLAAVR